MEELILLESLMLPKKNFFTGILKGLCLFICNTPFFFLTTDTLKTDGTEDSLHSTDESEKEENDTFISNLQDYRFLNFCFLRLLEVLTFRFDLHYKHFRLCYLIGKMLFCIFSTKPMRISREEVHI